MFAGCLLIAYGPPAVLLLTYASRRSALLILTIARCELTKDGRAAGLAGRLWVQSSWRPQRIVRLLPLLQRVLLAPVDFPDVSGVDRNTTAEGM